MAEISPVRPVAYFCAEYGIQAHLPLYAGGLGVLAGDTVKEAADQEFPLVSVGFLYRGGNARQVIDENGKQTETDMEIDPVALGFEHVYVPYEDQPLFVRIHLTKQDVWARIWKKTIKRNHLFLLDTNTDQNEPEDRSIGRALYYGREEELLKQQMVLGIGGVKLLDALDIHPSLYHVNEGRPAFLYWQLIRQLMEQSGLPYAVATQEAKKMIVYTNHTLVRDGNASYDKELLKTYAAYYADKMGVSIDELLKPGIEDTTSKFNLTQFALNTSARASSVSEPHYQLSRNLWPEFEWVNVTNGVHMPTWQSVEIAQNSSDSTRLWQVHLEKKEELARYVQSRTGYTYDSNRMVMVWSRRMASYKRMNALIEDIERMAKILSNAEHPVQLLVSGKAHASDTAAKQMLTKIIKAMQDNWTGYALYIPDYDIEVAQHLVTGADVWLNTPIQGQEASGTSGMKAIANGVLQLTVKDGWSAEFDWDGIGWNLDNNQLALSLYEKLESEIVPLYYERNENNVPQRWVKMMQASINKSKHYSTTRMLDEYKEKLYTV